MRLFEKYRPKRWDEYDSGGIFVAAAGHVPSKAIALLDEAVRKSISNEV